MAFLRKEEVERLEAVAGIWPQWLGLSVLGALRSLDRPSTGSIDPEQQEKPVHREAERTCLDRKQNLLRPGPLKGLVGLVGE